MSAIPKSKNAFQLFKRNDNDVVKARPYTGDHNALIEASVKTVSSAHRDTIMELAKV